MKIWKKDPWLEPYGKIVERRNRQVLLRKQQIAGYGKPLKNAINGALYSCILSMVSIPLLKASHI